MKTILFLLLFAASAFAKPVKLAFSYDEEDFVTERAVGFRIYAVPVNGNVIVTEVLVADLVTHATGEKGVVIDLDHRLRWHIYMVIFNEESESDPSNTLFFGKPTPPGLSKLTP
jgi:hypothetical protein